MFGHSVKYRLRRIVDFTDVWYVPGLQNSLFSLHALRAKVISFQGRDSEISLFGKNLIFSLMSNLYKMTQAAKNPALEKLPVLGCNFDSDGSNR